MINFNELNEVEKLHLKLQIIAEELNDIAENNEYVCGALYSDIKKAYELIKTGII